MDLFERTWPLPGARAGVVIVHGLAEHSGRYDHVARALNAAGYAVYAQDVRGHGRSPGFPGEMGELDDLYADVVAYCTRIASMHPHTFLLAHSMGTLLTLPAVTQMPDGTLDGYVVSGTALLPGPAILESLVTGAGVPPDKVSRDPDIVRAYVEDPLVFYDRVPQKVSEMALEATQRASAAVPLVRIPVLIVHGGSDEICDIQGAQYLHTELVGTDKTLLVYDGLYHEVLNEPEKDRVIADIVEWLDGQVAGKLPEERA